MSISLSFSIPRELGFSFYLYCQLRSLRCRHAALKLIYLGSNQLHRFSTTLSQDTTDQTLCPLCIVILLIVPDYRHFSIAATRSIAFTNGVLKRDFVTAAVGRLCQCCKSYHPDPVQPARPEQVSRAPKSLGLDPQLNPEVFRGQRPARLAEPRDVVVFDRITILDALAGGDSLSRLWRRSQVAHPPQHHFFAHNERIHALWSSYGPVSVWWAIDV